MSLNTYPRPPVFWSVRFKRICVIPTRLDATAVDMPVTVQPDLFILVDLYDQTVLNYQSNRAEADRLQSLSDHFFQVRIPFVACRSSHLYTFEQDSGQITLGTVRQDDDDSLAGKLIQIG